jgi:hypothetical protein
LDPTTVLRVVIAGHQLHKRDFRLRKHEEGLSVFAEGAGVDGERVISVLRAAGKLGNLSIAELQAADVEKLGLNLVRVPIETGDPMVDACHFEIRLSAEQREALDRLALDARRYFNDEIAPRLCELARPIG